MHVDISHKGTRDVFELFKQWRRNQYVSTVCDESSVERCPLFPGILETIHWSFDDPASFTGSDGDKLKETLRVRDQIKENLQAWVKEIQA